MHRYGNAFKSGVESDLPGPCVYLVEVVYIFPESLGYLVNKVVAKAGVTDPHGLYGDGGGVLVHSLVCPGGNDILHEEWILAVKFVYELLVEFNEGDVVKSSEVHDRSCRIPCHNEAYIKLSVFHALGSVVEVQEVGVHIAELVAENPEHQLDVRENS